MRCAPKLALQTRAIPTFASRENFGTLQLPAGSASRDQGHGMQGRCEGAGWPLKGAGRFL